MPEPKETTHTLIERALIVYRRERSGIWQCRYKVDGVWQRASTKESDLTKAKARTHELRMEAEIRRRSNLPVITRKFRDVARLAVERLEHEIAVGKGKRSYTDYIRVINDYLIPILGKRSITSIDYQALDELNIKRAELMEKVPTQSTMLTHNAALNRVFDEAVIRGFLTEANKPKLEATGKKSERRAAFDMSELRALLANFDDWIEAARTEQSKEMRQLMRDYVDVLLDTGARPGTELLNLQWRQIKFAMKPTLKPTGEIDNTDDAHEEMVLPNLNRSVEMVVSGKTGTRTIVGMLRTVKALERIAVRNYQREDDDEEASITDPFKKLTVPTNTDFVFRTKNKEEQTSWQKMFESYLKEHNLLIDPITGNKRVFYSLRHTYATLALTNDQVPIHTLAKQMGTSVLMIEKHYSHLKVVQAIDQLRGEETRRLIDAGGVVDEIYTSKRKQKKGAA
uniref:tyrosine-type recombinase/integrase n=1 Tax=Polynucleobacter sp. TaxID=2029855 RepID=UPI004048BB3F